MAARDVARFGRSRQQHATFPGRERLGDHFLVAPRKRALDARP